MVATRQSSDFLDWLASLSDQRARNKIAIRIARVEAGLLGDVKSVGGGVSELRIDYGPGYRLYFTRRGQQIIILLCGGDKSSQARDIKAAQSMALEL